MIGTKGTEGGRIRRRKFGAIGKGKGERGKGGEFVKDAVADGDDRKTGEWRREGYKAVES